MRLLCGLNDNVCKALNTVDGLQDVVNMQLYNIFCEDV